jgi:hypothetical protein
MGLEEFVDIETSEPNDDAESEEETLKAVNSGPYGYPSFEEYEDTVTGHIEKHGDLFKYRLPIFPVIEHKEIYDTESRYTIGPEEAIVSCVSSNIRVLSNIPRDIIMLDTGEVEKQECMDVLSERFGTEVSPDMNVTLSMFSQVRQIVKMAIGDSMTDDWSLKQKDHVLKSIYDESYTQRFRNSSDIDEKLKKTDHIGNW